jgi:cytochrome c biogenesis protein CcmG/thiol:disulfide interchange protein DsbE
MNDDSDVLPPAGGFEGRGRQRLGLSAPALRGAACVVAVLVIAATIAILHGHSGSHPSSTASGALDSRSPVLNQPAPDFALVDLNGKRVRLGDLRGQIVLVNFWATWCGPCRAELPAIDDVYREQRDSGFTVLEVNEQESSADVSAFMSQIGQMPPVILDTNGSVMTQYRLKGLPDSFVIDRQGIVRGLSFGPVSRETILKYIDGARAAP